DLMDGLHVVLDAWPWLRWERTFVLDLLLAHLAPACIDRRIVHICRYTMHQVARADGIQKSRRVVAMEGVFHCIEVIQISPVLIEAVDGGEEFVAITEMIFAELAGGIAHGFQRCCDRWRLRRHPRSGASLSDRREASPDRQFPGDEVRAPGGTTRFRIIVCEAHTLAGHPVQIGRAAGHDALIVDTNVRPADVIPHDHNDIWPLPRGSGL